MNTAYKHQILQEATHFVEDSEILFESGQFWKIISDMMQEKNGQCQTLKEQFLIWSQHAQTYEKNQVLLKRIEENMKKG